jgi:hypothetical protein
VCGLAYCQEGLTDGFIPLEALPYLGVKSPSKHVSVLVKAGLWETCDGGWRVHDYLQHQKSATEIGRIVEWRQRAGAEGGRRSGEERRRRAEAVDTERLVKQDVEANTKQAAEACSEANVKQTSNPDQIRTDQNRSEQGRGARAPLHDTSHVKHAFCGRVCMPKPLFDEFVRRRNTLNADSEIIDWALVIDKDWSVGGRFADTEPGDPYAFWKARYAEKWPVIGGASKPGCAPVRLQHSPSVIARMQAIRERELEIEQERAQKQAGEAS